MPVAGQIDDAGGLRRSRVGTSNRRRADSEISPRNRAQSRDSAQELALAVALYARESDDLAGTDLKIDSLQDGAGQAAHRPWPERRAGPLCPSLGKRVQQSAR